MPRVSYPDLQALAADYEGGTVELSPFSLALLLALLAPPWEIFYWSNLTGTQRDEAEAAVATAIAELHDVS